MTAEKKDPYAIWDRIRGRFTEKQLCHALRNYTRRGSGCYDPELDRKIRELKPGWFRDPDGAAKKKAELLAMAARGEGRPASAGKNKHPLGAVLCCYTSLGHTCYDPVFDQQIRAAAPSWFLVKVALNKTELLAMAARGEGRPAATGKNKHPLGKALCRYIDSRSKCYDAVFAQVIKAAAPGWFLDTAALNKTELLAMAARGEGRPAATGKNKHPLGKALCEYTGRKSDSYDAVFAQAIKAAAPGWFLDTAALNKAELLAMAGRGEGRPAAGGKNKHPLGAVLCQYTRPGSSCYDSVFDQQIRQAAPRWFIKADKLRKARKETVNA
jgi:hypothetical protein